MTTTENTGRAQDPPVRGSGPERSFRVAEAEAEARVVTTTMTTGPWLNGPWGQPTGGALGVLVDNALGYAIMLGRPPEHWSVSSEISIDVCGPIPADGSRLRAEGHNLHSDSHGGISTGSVFDDRGRLVAVGRQHGRWVRPVFVPLPEKAPTDLLPDAADLPTLLGTRAKPTDAGAELDLVATDDLINPLGNLHGGIALCASDIVAHTALAVGGRPSSTTSVHIAYVRPVPLGTAVRFTASVAHSGRSFSVVTVTSTNEAGKPCTISTVTAAALERPHSDTVTRT